ncbi:Pr6Pr family membrane protein [Cellulosimicrobium cellulans]|uniref:Pr6Pr family membrane protein n=1 Tax=Cellulosimicrobium cellulans TaxID=1710 RepID=UPI0029E7D383|nr:Pr6Pr family membrane protein [Cellulosimicrobium cellulans]
MTDAPRVRADAGRHVVARTLHALVAVAALTGVVLEVAIALVDGPGTAPSQAERLVRLFSYFTIQSNLLVGGVSVLLAARPARDGTVFRVARLDALLCIAVTGIVYNTVLRGLQDLTSAGQVSNLLLHLVAPLLAVAAWGLVGPRPRVDAATVWWSVAYPLAWIAYTFVRGAVVGWYPYPFLDVGELGLGRALVNTGVVAVVFLALAWLVRLVDSRLRPAP